jgi:hypothetical protein
MGSSAAGWVIVVIIIAILVGVVSRRQISARNDKKK